MALIDLVRSPLFLFKVVELVLTVVIAGLTSGRAVATASSGDYLASTAAVDGSVIGYIMLGCVFVLGYVLACPVDRRLTMITSAAGVILFITTAGLVLQVYSEGAGATEHLVAGIFALGTAIIHGLDAFLTWKLVE